MPGGNRRGPSGQGPKTGRAAGYCAGNDVPGSETGGAQGAGGQGRGRGRGRGRGGGRGRGRGGGRGRGRGGGGGRGSRTLFHATGLTGWQRASAGQQAFGQPPEPEAEPEAASEAASESASVAEADDVPPDERALLRQRLADLTAALQQVENRLRELEGAAESRSNAEPSD